MWKQRESQLILPSASTNYEIWCTLIRQEVKPTERNQIWKWRNANTNASTPNLRKVISKEASSQHLAKKKKHNQTLSVLTSLFSIWIFEHWDICQMTSKANFHLTWANRWSQTLAQPLKAAVYECVKITFWVLFTHRERIDSYIVFLSSWLWKGKNGRPVSL